jgi:nicotinamide mononucleotide transporter
MSILEWIADNWVELTGAAAGLVAIVFQVRQNPLVWPVSLLTVVLYIWVYTDARLYAEVSLQVYYLVVSVYGWYYWVNGKKDEQKSGVPVSLCSWQVRIILVGIATALFFGMAYLLKEYTNTDVPWSDAFVTSLSFIATWLLARKKLENWLVWILADAYCIGVYIYKELYPTTVLFTVLTILAVVGYYQWKKDLVKASA